MLVFLDKGNEESESGGAHYDTLMDMLSSADSADNGCGLFKTAYKRLNGDEKLKRLGYTTCNCRGCRAIRNVINEMECK